MKPYLFFFITAILICSEKSFSQIDLNKMKFCHDEQDRLQYMTSDIYQFSFDNQKLKSFQLKNGNLSYDLEKNIIQFFEKGKPIIKVELQNDGKVSISDFRRNDIHRRSPVKEIEGCISQSNNIEIVTGDSIMISFIYTYCRLIALSVSSANFGSVNLFPLQKIGGRSFSWDFMYTSATVSHTEDLCVKILTDRKAVLPDFISISDDIRNAERFKRCAGMEITGTRGKSNRFNKVTLVTDKIKPDDFEFTDILKYNNRGKLIESKEGIKVSDCN